MIIPVKTSSLPPHLKVENADSHYLSPLSNHKVLRRSKSRELLSSFKFNHHHSHNLHVPSDPEFLQPVSSSVSSNMLTPSTNRARSASKSFVSNITEAHRRQTDPQGSEYLQLIDPSPVYPPEYSVVPPGGCPRFPILPRIEEGHEKLPQYSPSLYKIAYLARKLEWISPYEPSPLRQWKNLIIEINSTQLNLYSANNDKLNWFFPRPDLDLMSRSSNPYNKNYKAPLTNERDLQFLKFVDDLNLKNSKTLIRSYSLQHAKIGSAQDYKKKKYVLRIRAETEQFLIGFKNSEDLIDWHSALCCARDLSLDISNRELPKYRTVPRRRRRNNNNSNNRRRAQSDSNLNTISSNLTRSFFNRRGSSSRLSHQISSSSLNSYSSSNDSSRPSLKNSFSKLKLKFSSSRLNDGVLSYSKASASNDYRNEQYDLRPPPMINIDSSQCISHHDFSANQDYDCSSTHETINTINTTNTMNPSDRDDDDDDDDDDVHDIRDLHESDEELDDLDDIDDVDEIHEAEAENQEEEEAITIEDDAQQSVNLIVGDEPNRANSITNEFFSSNFAIDEPQILSSSLNQTISSNSFNSQITNSLSSYNCYYNNSNLSSSSDDSTNYKWRPIYEKIPSKKKLIRDALRCIPPLASDEQWSGKHIVKPTLMSQGNLLYLRSYHNNNDNSTKRNLNTNNIGNNNIQNYNGNKLLSRKFSALKIGDALNDVSLSRMPNHFVQEYNVGPHGLIPKLY